MESQRGTEHSAPKQTVLQETVEGGPQQNPRTLVAEGDMTQAEMERGAVTVIKCKLCSNPRFGTWMTFQRHCKS